MALLLGVCRTQWSMYTLGQRGLPVQSKLKLEKILMNVNKVAVQQKVMVQSIEKQKEQRKEVVGQLIQHNQLKQLQLIKKIDKMESKFQAALHTLQFVNTMKNNTKGVEQSVLKGIQFKSEKALLLNGLGAQEGAKIKLEVLQFEAQLLKKRKQNL
jgi:hypothetical protein